MRGDTSAQRFTDRVRQELGRQLPRGPAERRAELTALVGLAGALHRRGDDAGGHLRVELTTASGAVARAAFRLLHDELDDLAVGDDARPELLVHEPGGIRRTTTYTVAVEDGVHALAARLGVLDADGRPTAAVPEQVLDGPRTRLGFTRGALLASASFSSPGRQPHLEVIAPNEPLAQAVARCLQEAADHPPGVGRIADRWRVTIKSGEAIGTLLSAVGATGAFLAWDEQRLRRQLRSEANRLTNADAANLRRAVEAAGEQVRAVEQAITTVGWEALDDDLRQVALARLANPGASLAEIGELCDPPLGKSSVHRRLQRLADLAADRSR